MEENQVPRMTVVELKQKLDRGDELSILDARSQDAYEVSNFTIPGAIRKDPHDVDSWAGDLDTALEHVTFCT